MKISTRPQRRRKILINKNSCLLGSKLSIIVFSPYHNFALGGAKLPSPCLLCLLVFVSPLSKIFHKILISLSSGVVLGHKSEATMKTAEFRTGKNKTPSIEKETPPIKQNYFTAPPHTATRVA